MCTNIKTAIVPRASPFFLPSFVASFVLSFVPFLHSSQVPTACCSSHHPHHTTPSCFLCTLPLPAIPQAHKQTAAAAATITTTTTTTNQ
jgi:hypothetical protein